MPVVNPGTESAKYMESPCASVPSAVVFVWGTWVLMLLGNLAIVNTYTSNYPFSDELYLITQSLTPQWLWAQHAEHRVPLAKLVWSSTLKLTNYEFRVGNSISVLTVGAVAMAMTWAARTLRGWTSFTDSFFSLVWLNFGQAINFLWWWVFNHILAPVLASCVLLIIVLRGKQLTPRSAILAGVCLVLLALSGPGGLPYALALALWLCYRGILFWQIPSGRHSKREWELAIGLAVLAILLVALYFVNYSSPASTAAGQLVSAVSLRTSLETSRHILSLSLGPAVRSYWRLVGSAVCVLWLLSVAVLLVALFRNTQERLRTLGLLLFIGAAGALVLIVGYARAGLGQEYVSTGIYLNMVLPAFCCIYFIWIEHGTSTVKSLMQVSLFSAACLFLLPNWDYGLGFGRHFGAIGKVLDHDIRAGVPPFILAERHMALLNPATGDVKQIASRLREMQRAGIPQFKHMAPDPAFREVALPVAPMAMNHVVWQEGIGYSCTADPSKASVDFAFPESRFVYAIRLLIGYEPQAPG